MKKLLLCVSFLAFGASASHAVNFENKTNKNVKVFIQVGDLKFSPTPEITIKAKESANFSLADHINKEIKDKGHSAAITIRTSIGSTAGCNVFEHLYTPNTENPNEEGKFINGTEFDKKIIQIKHQKHCHIS